MLAVAVAAAGCGGFFAGDETAPTHTLTPAAVPTDEPTATPLPTVAPGLSARGVADPGALVDAHAAVLANTSYTVRTRDIEAVRERLALPPDDHRRPVRAGPPAVRLRVERAFPSGDGRVVERMALFADGEVPTGPSR